MSDDRYRPDRPVFCGNFEYDAPVRDIERLFDKYGPVERVDMKTGFAFVYMRDRRDGDDAIDALDGSVHAVFPMLQRNGDGTSRATAPAAPPVQDRKGPVQGPIRREYGHRRRRLKVEWAKGNGEVKKREEQRRRAARPATTLFVANFDVGRTRERDLERVFEKYGRLTRVQIKRNYAFVQYTRIEDAERALRDTQGAPFEGRTLAVEYVANEMGSRGDDRDGTRSRDRSRSRSPAYRRCSPSPVRRRSRSRDDRSRSPVRRDSPSPRPRSESPRRSRSPERGDYERPASRSRSRSRSRGRSPGSRSPPPRDLSRSPGR